MTTIKNLGKGARRMVRFPGPFNKSKRKQKKLQKANGLLERAPNSFTSADEGTDFYSDLEEVLLAPPACSFIRTPQTPSDVVTILFLHFT